MSLVAFGKSIIVYILAFVFFLGIDSYALTTPHQIRSDAYIKIRIFKDLPQFPYVVGSTIKQINSNTWLLRGGRLSHLGQKLPQSNVIHLKENKKYDLIAALKFNDYLIGVVSSEMPVSWPIEALKAQAVVARSYALARINERSELDYHLDSDQTDQVYNFSQNEKAKKAVFETQNIILTTSKADRILKAYYHADCGGHTVPASEVWGYKAADTGTAIDPWCAERQNNQWSFEISKSDFFKKLSLNSEGQNIDFSSRAQIIGIGSSFFSIQKLREVFGFFKIRSAASVFNISEEKVKLSGQGFGHGAGLCQWGTLSQAKEGRTHLQILSHYYPKAKIYDLKNKQTHELKLASSKNFLHKQSVSN